MSPISTTFLKIFLQKESPTRRQDFLHCKISNTSILQLFYGLALFYSFGKGHARKFLSAEPAAALLVVEQD